MALRVGYPEFTTEDFYETAEEEFQKLEKDNGMAELHKSFNDDGISNYIVTYFRIITGAYMKANPDSFQFFIEGGLSIDQFCASQVDPFGVDCEQLQILALTQALNIGVSITYLDRSAGDEPHSHAMPEGAEEKVCVLYRPGHYDVLYKS
eukprot:m.206815 g.206815  ORF g.206815 m.206815 type:complete len:150 (+) comp13758_c0_seq4:330-779(+)